MISDCFWGIQEKDLSDDRADQGKFEASVLQEIDIFSIWKFKIKMPPCNVLKRKYISRNCWLKSTFLSVSLLVTNNVDFSQQLPRHSLFMAQGKLHLVGFLSSRPALRLWTLKTHKELLEPWLCSREFGSPKKEGLYAALDPTRPVVLGSQCFLKSRYAWKPTRGPGNFCENSLRSDKSWRNKRWLHNYSVNQHFPTVSCFVGKCYDQFYLPLNRAIKHEISGEIYKIFTTT